MGEYTMRHLLKQGFGVCPHSAQFWLPFRQLANWRLKNEQKQKLPLHVIPRLRTWAPLTQCSAVWFVLSIV